MKIFISYASEQANTAEDIAFALRAEQHSVFLDRSALEPGDAYNQHIREEIEDCHLFIFLITPQSVAKGRYTLTELGFAEKKWPNPSGKILPVMIGEKTPMTDIPAYLRAVTILDVTGNLAATVVATVDKFQTKGIVGFFKRFRFLFLFTLFLAILTLAVTGYYWVEESNRIENALKEANSLYSSEHYEEAFDRFVKEKKPLLDSNAYLKQEAKFAMDWLDYGRLHGKNDSWTRIIQKVSDTLTKCVVSDDKVLAADCLAHLGWGDYLKSREGQSGLNPKQIYQRALDMDSANPFANALLGFQTIVSGGSLDEANKYYQRAFASGREHEYVRVSQLDALLFSTMSGASDQTIDSDIEALKIFNEMRLHNESLPAFAHSDLIYSVSYIYDSRVCSGNELQSFLTAISPTDHLATFKWLIANENDRLDKVCYTFTLGTFQELAGNKIEAFHTFTNLKQVLEGYGINQYMKQKSITIEAIERLSN